MTKLSISQIERQTEREEIFLSMLEEGFKHANIIELLEPASEGSPNRVCLEVLILPKTTQLDKRAIIFQPETSLMTEEGSNHKRIFRSGIIKAQEILSNPPLKDNITQGTLILKSDEVTFNSHP